MTPYIYYHYDEDDDDTAIHIRIYKVSSSNQISIVRHSDSSLSLRSTIHMSDRINRIRYLLALKFAYKLMHQLESLMEMNPEYKTWDTEDLLPLTILSTITQTK